ncbi:MAG: HlyD family type I secretion periplasmic adaptor subunit [Steroidobacteraceae bacterium]|nr:HlyD family type I secretion periplasmic adaptor subunit [Steroidobacteraceae bacterium]
MSLRGEDLAYATDMQQALLGERSRASGVSLALMAAVLVAALAWAASTRVEEVTKGEARIIPSSREQVIQSLEGGILKELRVREGDVVAAGQPLLRIDPTKADASFKEGRSKELALRATIARLEAESRGTPLRFPPPVAADGELVRNETAAYLARRRALEQGIAALKRSKGLLEREIAMTRPMVERGLVAEVELLRMERQYNELDLQVNERDNKYRADAAAELSRSEGELAQLDGVLAARKDMLDRTVIRAPLRGTVKNVRVNTIGGVIQPGQDIMEIVPLEDQLLVEAKIPPREVAFLRPGLPAQVKLTAYDYTIYGALDGTVELISPDTLREERKADEASYYRVLVRTRQASLRAGGKDLPIIPGMTATVEVRTGEKRVLDYLLKPVLRSQEAFRER